jgi:hypothetical protein
MISNRNDADKDLRALRRNGDTPSAPSGYTDRSGRTVAQPGNDKAPYVWNAPFSEPMQRIGSLEGVEEGEHVYPFVSLEPNWGTCFPAVDVSDYRVISILLAAETTNPDLELQLLPLTQFAILDPALETDPFNFLETWTPIAFVNPDPTDIQIEFKGPGGAQRSQSVVQRTIGPLMLKTLKPGVDAQTGKGLVQFAMDFEVASHKQFTMSIVSLTDPGAISGGLYYTRRM